ncbi:hypothetical protein BpHYR1_013903 [Brachionus plicatilis]|uniref:Uncharacterized protein n=1 Tax=Brachionus plicatilis TaxID=10195 RepID=A0A3M7R057_BRAPC|nr:hypothetical protein BpHYR1_013903 [Brachionus plicatilis]
MRIKSKIVNKFNDIKFYVYDQKIFDPVIDYLWRYTCNIILLTYFSVSNYFQQFTETNVSKIPIKRNEKLGRYMGD